MLHNWHKAKDIHCSRGLYKKYQKCCSFENQRTPRRKQHYNGTKENLELLD